jgi:hypothetical protein
MRKRVVLGLSLLAIGSVFPIGTHGSQAHEGAWCALYPSSEGVSENCALSSFEMCRREIRGSGGTSFCAPNAWYLPTPATDGPRPNDRGRHHRG